jgi:hypothetical protein
MNKDLLQTELNNVFCIMFGLETEHETRENR